jgi:Putative GTPase activating protein for Arf
MLSYMGIQKDRQKVKDKDENGYYQRIKVLLKDPENKQCAECRKEKSKWMSILQFPLHKEQTEVGVFVCNNCQAFHAALGEEFCQVKNLKDPDSCEFNHRQ